MIRFSLAAFLSLAAAQAMAHGGAHLHPHSAEGWMIGLALMVIAGAGALVFRGRR